MVDKTVLHSLTHESGECAERDIFFKDYVCSFLPKLDRDGLFFSVFNKMFDAQYSAIPHVLASGFEAFNAQEEFFHIYSQKNAALENADEIILLFHLNPLECSLEVLTDFLIWFRPKIKKETRLIAHYHYAADLEKVSDQIYVTSFFRTILQHLELIPEAWTVLQLEKRPSFENAVVVEAGAQWKCLDNYLVHAILSKGGSLIQQKIGFDYEIVSEEEISPFHSVRLLKRKSAGRARCENFNELKKKNFLKHPEDIKVFYYLIYKNIYK